MSTAQITVQSDADFAAMFAAAGLVPRLVAEEDLLPQTGLFGVWECTDVPGATTLTDNFVGGDVHRDVATVGATFDGTKLTLASTTAAKITLPVTATPTFELTLLIKVSASGTLLSPYATGAGGKGVNLSANTTVFSGGGNFSFVAYNDNAGGTNVFVGAAGQAHAGVWRIVAVSLDAATRLAKIRSDLSDPAAVVTGTTTPIPPIGGNVVIGAFAALAAAGCQIGGIAYHTRQLAQAERDQMFQFMEKEIATPKGIVLGAA